MRGVDYKILSKKIIEVTKIIKNLKKSHINKVKNFNYQIISLYIKFLKFK